LECIKNGKSSKNIRLSWYQSIDKKHFYYYLKLEVDLSIPFTRKMRSKNVRLFPRSVLSSKGGGWKSKKVQPIWKLIGFEPQFFIKSYLILRTEI
jgi:hypothetical protein